jgi:integrase/recombinase XerD
MRYRNEQYDALWQTEERTPLTRNGLAIAMKRLSQRANIKDAKLGAHTFRHTCAYLSLENGADIYDLKELYGHKKIQTTQIYLDGYGSKMAAAKHEKFSPVEKLNL